ncbi:MAG: hypothetical protein ACOCVQ_04450 [Bacillota bacterium]
MGEARHISVELTEDLVKEMDDLARVLGLTRDELIYDVMSSYLRARKNYDLRQSLRSGYESMGELNLSIAEYMLPLENEGSEVHMQQLLGGGDFAGC